MLRPHILKKISGQDADLLASLDFSMLVYNIRLLKVSRNVCPGMLVDVLPSAPPFSSQLLPRSQLRLKCGKDGLPIMLYFLICRAALGDGGGA